MKSIELKCEGLSKKFINKIIFKNLDLQLSGGDSLAITGRNGTGKSTLIKVISNLIRESSGKVILKIEGKEIPQEKRFKHIGLAAPYLNLYDELNAYENLDFFYRLKNKTGEKSTEEKINSLLERVNLHGRRKDLIKNYSSGMKQRLKMAFSILSEPEILFLDEPRTNLDKDGIEIAYSIAEEQKQRGILIIATNEAEDLHLCERKINIEDFSNYIS